MDFAKLLKNGMPESPLAVRGISLDSMDLALHPPYLIPPSKQNSLIGRHYFVPISPNFEESGLMREEGYALFDQESAIQEASDYALYHARSRFLERMLGFKEEPAWLKQISPDADPEQIAHNLATENGLSEEKAERIANVTMGRRGLLLFPQASLFEKHSYRPGKQSGYITIVSNGGIDVENIYSLIPLGKEEKYILESLKTSGNK